MTPAKQLDAIDAAITHLEIALKEAKAARDDVETGRFTVVSTYPAKSAVRRLEQLNEGAQSARRKARGIPATRRDGR